MLSPDIILVKVASLLQRVLDDLFGSRHFRQFALCGCIGAAADQFFDFQADRLRIDTEVLQNLDGDAVSLLDKSQKQMLGANVFMPQPLRICIG